MHKSGPHSSEQRDAVSEKSVDVAVMLEEWFLEHQEELLGTVYYLIGNLPDAQDAVQEAFVRSWNHRNQLPQVRDLKAWIYRITLNVARDIRKAAWNQRRKSFPDDLSSLAAKEKTPDEIVAEDEQIQLLRKWIAALEEPDKEVFLLRQNGDLTYPQIAELLGIPEGTVKTRMRKAIEKMRNEK